MAFEHEGPQEDGNRWDTRGQTGDMRETGNGAKGFG